MSPLSYQGHQTKHTVNLPRSPLSYKGHQYNMPLSYQGHSTQYTPVTKVTLKLLTEVTSIMPFKLPNTAYRKATKVTPKILVSPI